MPFLVSAFSANMLPVTGESRVTFTPISTDKARELAPDCRSAVGHEDTARVFAATLGTPVPFNRQDVTVKAGDRLLLGQVSGPRLPAGATSLPDGAQIVWFQITVA